MEISHLKEFIALADKLDYGLAAKKLYVTEAELSRHISQMEEEIGVALFARNVHGGVTLTDMGKIFHKGAESVTKRYEQTLESIEEAKGKPQKTLRIGYLYDASRDELPYITNALAQIAPDFKPRYIPLGHKDLQDRLVNNKVDAAVAIVTDRAITAGFDTVVLDQDVYEVVAPKDHPFAKMDSVSLKQIAAENVIIPNPKTMSGMSDFFCGIFKDAGIDLVPSAFYDDVPSLAFQIESGEGISMVLSQRRGHYDDTLAFIPISDPLPTADITLIWRDDIERVIPGDWVKAFRSLSIG